MCQGRHSIEGSALLAPSHCSGGNEQASILAPETTTLPLTTGRVPEGLPLSWEGAVTSGNALYTWSTRDCSCVEVVGAYTYEQEGIVLLEGLRVGGRDAGVLGRSVHLFQDLLWKRFADLEDVGRTASLFDASCLLLGQLLDVAPGGVLENCHCQHGTSQASTSMAELFGSRR